MYGSNNIYGIPATGYGSTNFLGQQAVPAPLPYSGKIPRVHGEAGVDAYRMATDSSTFLADETEDNIVWIKATDAGGYVTKTKFRLVPVEEEPKATDTKYVTKEEFDDLREKVDKVLKELS